MAHKKTTKMSAEHKAALAEGRRQSRIVRSYLEALEDSKRGPGRPVNPETVQRKLKKLNADIEAEPNPAKRLELVQARIDAEQQLASLEEAADLESLEEEFKQVVADYSERKGISYTAWRELGVPAAALREAGVPRTRRGS